MAESITWHLTEDEVRDLAYAIVEFQRKLPGWWFTVGNCHLSADASCGPDRTGPDAWLLPLEVPGIAGELFDGGFHCDDRYDLGPRPTLAKSLRIILDVALAARNAVVERMARDG